MSSDQRQGAATSDYREVLPPRELAGYFLCLWSQTIHGPEEFQQRVLPDGCIDIVVVNDVPMLAGPWTKPFTASFAPGTTITGARFHPGAASSLLGLPASELLNAVVPLDEIWSRPEAARFSTFSPEWNAAQRTSAMARVLAKRTSGALPVDWTVGAAIRWIARHPRGRMEELGRTLHLGNRQLQRRFTAAVGYGPKLFQSILRFQRSLALANHGGVQGDLARIAAEAEYADQAHMSREVQRFSGVPPAKLLHSARSTLQLSELVRV
jgi:AraC-like DNA-binding protein